MATYCTVISLWRIVNVEGSSVLGCGTAARALAAADVSVTRHSERTCLPRHVRRGCIGVTPLLVAEGFRSPCGLRGSAEDACEAWLDAAQPRSGLEGPALCTAVAITFRGLLGIGSGRHGIRVGYYPTRPTQTRIGPGFGS